MSFILPPFWAPPVGGYGLAPHAVSVLVDPPTEEPLTIAEGKLRAALDWPDGDPRDALMEGFIAAARAKVEHRTGLALLTQTRDVYLDTLPPYGRPIVLPALALPLQEVDAFTYIDSADVAHVIDPAGYVVDRASGRIGLAMGAAWPTDVRAFQPFTIRVIAGWLDVAALTAAAPLLVHAVGLLVAHFATSGRDLATLGSIVTTPQGFEDAIGPYVQESLA